VSQNICYTFNNFIKTEAEFIKLYHEYKSTILIIKTMKKHHPEMKVLSKMLIYSLVGKFKVKGTINDTRHNTSIGRSMSACTTDKH
jgi:hypothetical protein